MPIEDFEGKTFVAFMDIVGFKKMMKESNKAWKVLHEFYNCGYKTLKWQNFECQIDGIFVSDCGVLFARGRDSVCQLKALLNVVKEINKKMLERDVMLTLLPMENFVIRNVSSFLV